MAKSKRASVVQKPGGKIAVRDFTQARVTPVLSRGPSKPLYVMLTEDQKSRYEAAAKAVGMSMREYVTMALEAQVAQQSADRSDLMSEVSRLDETMPDAGDVAALRMFVMAQQLRVGTVERELAALRKRVEQLEPTEFPPREWFDEHGNMKPRNG